MSALFDTDFRRRKARLATPKRMGYTRLVSVKIPGGQRVQSPTGVVHAVETLSNEADCGVRVSTRARPQRAMKRGWQLLDSRRGITCSRCAR